MSKLSKQALLGIGLAGLLFEIVARPALSVDKVSLFKVTTPRGEMVIGLTYEELEKMKGHDAGAVAKAIADQGALEVWQYDERKVGKGEVMHVPVKYVGLQWRDAIRIETYPTRSKVVPISEYSMRQ
ncbi:MAG: hypothetical protein ACOY4O_06080 [Pseudomonadota bacterium]|jgi:hypothetical protein